jgi:hypothetical protein
MLVVGRLGRKKIKKMMKNKNEGGGQGAIWSIGIQEEYHLGMQGVIISHVIHQQQHKQIEHH